MKQKTIAFGMRPSAKISTQSAQEQHVAYLEHGPHVMKGENIVHSLVLEKQHLELLNEYGTGGIRLYFCRETSGGDVFLNIIAVPFDETGENVLTDSNNQSLIMNNMEPCPDRCPKFCDYENSYSVTDFNYKIHTDNETAIWCKPNMETIDGKIWFDESGNPVI